jgi:patatin-like phospholipase/acyl hydrolase
VKSAAQTLSTEQAASSAPFRVLSLDGGGAKGFYTLGVLQKIEEMIGPPLGAHFDLIYGTSTGAIIAALLALGRPVTEIRVLYEQHVPILMGNSSARARTAALKKLAAEVFGERTFTDFNTAIGIVTTRWKNERPMIFKSRSNQAFGGGKFTAGFGALISDAIVASCSAYPFFERAIVRTTDGPVELIDGGYCANNPTLYAISDAVGSLNIEPSRIRVLSLGVGTFPEPKRITTWFARKLLSVQLLQKTLEINTNTMEQLRRVLFKDIATIRISDTFSNPDLAADLLENNPEKLEGLRQQGIESFFKQSSEHKAFLI